MGKKSVSRCEFSPYTGSSEVQGVQFSCQAFAISVVRTSALDEETEAPGS